MLYVLFLDSIGWKHGVEIPYVGYLFDLTTCLVFVY